MAFLVLAAIAYQLLGSQGSALYSVLSANKLNTSALANVIKQKLNATPSLSVNYSGTLTVNGSGSPLLGGLTLTLPVSIYYEKYHDDSRTRVDLRGVPVLGNMSIVEIFLNKTANSYLCFNLSGGFLSSLGGSNGSTGYRCGSNAETFGRLSNYSFLTPVDLVNLTRLNITSSSVMITSYRGRGCYLLVANGTVIRNNSEESSFLRNFFKLNATSHINLASCFSTDYYIPLNLSFRDAGPAGVSTFDLHETGFDTFVNDSALRSLPSPVNKTHGGFTTSIGGATTIPHTFGSGTPNLNITAYDSQDSYQRYWELFVRYPGTYSGSGSAYQTQPAYSSTESSGDTVRYNVYLTGLQTFYFVITQVGGSAYGTYSGTAHVNNVAVPFIGVDANHALKLVINDGSVISSTVVPLQ